MNQTPTRNTPASLEEIARRQALDHPNYFADAHKDQLVRLALSMAEEVCVLRDQLETASLLSEQGRQCTEEAIETFEPDAVLLEQRLARHTVYYEEILGKLLPAE